MAADFDALPFNARPDLTPYLVHLTKSRKGRSALENLIKILKAGKIKGSTADGYIKGDNPAACFMDVPFSALKYVLTPQNTDPEHPRYEAFGIIVQKKYAYKKGCRPVLYLSDPELQALYIPKGEVWRVVRLENLDDDTWISWLHEREWRCKGSYKLSKKISAVLVKDVKSAKKLAKAIKADPEAFKTIPQTIIPLNMICQGFIKE